MSDFVTDFDNYAGGFVAEDHGSGEDEIADATALPAELMSKTLSMIGYMRGSILVNLGDTLTWNYIDHLL